jgi:hypothetical protein
VNRFTAWSAYSAPGSRGHVSREALRVVHLVKAELSRRGVVLSGSVSQVEVEDPCRAGESRPEA